MEPFVYQRYLSILQINEMKSMKNRMEARYRVESDATLQDLKHGDGGIRDIEFVVQFLQLLYGGAHEEVRDANTLRALRKLRAVGCINADELSDLESAYKFLRRAEHQLQLLHDRQTHRLPGDLEELEAFARRLGWSDDEVSTAAEQFSRELAIVAGRVRRILRHLFINLFPRSESGGEDNGDVETDLVLDPNPDAAVVQSVLARRRFVDPQAAYRRLRALEAEDTPVLSTTRCRHFFANLAPRLLHEVGATPDPDMTLNNLEKVTSSLGAKGVLWESLTNHPQLLRMYVQLCASSQYLCDILTSNPGMIDEVLDLLFGVRTPSVMSLRRQLRGLLKDAD
ncbi:MAG: bifunctional [glutamate--ammonia ligase]-adenylyl-L-tyrosine phosphorylase/[glutamate--ammonia-ligase] adenylyltransferase, partial [Planctomycetia bacterium]